MLQAIKVFKEFVVEFHKKTHKRGQAYDELWAIITRTPQSWIRESWTCDSMKGKYLYVHDLALAKLILSAKSVRCYPGSIKNGSTSTKEKGIVVETITVPYKKGDLTFHRFPNLLSGDFEIKKDRDNYTWESVQKEREWGMFKISEFREAKGKE